MWKRTRHSQQQKQDPQEKAKKAADLELLKQAAADGEIVLKYLDESGCSLWSSVSYGYSPIGEQKCLEQTPKRWGRRISIIGILEQEQQFDYALVQGGCKSQSYIQIMDWQAEKASVKMAQTGQITVIVQDNGPIHLSKAAQAQREQWQTQGLFLFQLPKYCSQMNPIESEWHQLKTHELAGRMFDNEYDLTLAMIAGVEARSHKGGYSQERFKFNST